MQESLTVEEAQELAQAAINEVIAMKNAAEQRCVQLAADNRLLRMRLDKVTKASEVTKP